MTQKEIFKRLREIRDEMKDYKWEGPGKQPMPFIDYLIELQQERDKLRKMLKQ